MSVIERLAGRLAAATGEEVEAAKYGRGDWSLYVGGEFVCNAMSAAAMADCLRSMIAAAKEGGAE